MKRIERLISDAVYQEYLHRNLEAQTEERLCGYDLSHHFDVARIIYILVLERNELNYFVRDAELNGRLAAKEVLYAAGLLHDIGYWQEHEEGEDHAVVGALLAKDILLRVGFDEKETRIICRAIFEHRYINQEMSFLGERLLRADNLARNCSMCEFLVDCPSASTLEFSVSSIEY